MLVVDKKTFMFDTREIHSSDYPYDVDGYDVLTFQFCKNKVPAEGVVVRLEKLNIENYKYKAFRFLNKVDTLNNDLGVVDIEGS